MATYKDKLERIIAALSKTTGLTSILPGSKAYQLAESIAYEQMQLEFNVERYAQKNSILLAESSDLDNIGNVFFNLPRLKESAPFITADMRALKFYVANGTFGDINYLENGMSRIGQDIEIPEGTLINGVTPDGIRLVFRVTDYFTLKANQSEGFVSAELVQGSYDIIPPNVLRSHSFSSYSQAANNLLLVTNPVVIATGRGGESDENYRFRLTNALRAFPKTTLQGIHDTVISLADVSNAIIIPAANGGGTFDVYVQGVSPITSDATINNVRNVLADSVPPWASYNVLKPHYVGIEVSLAVTLINPVADTTSLKAQITEAVSRVINNSYATQFRISSILGAATQSSSNISSTNFVYIREHYGADNARKYKTIDFIADPNYAIFVGSSEKLIVEPIQNAVTVTI